MANGFIKKTGQTATDAAIKTARQVAQEPIEIIKSAVPVHMGEKDNSSLVAEMVQSGQGQEEITNVNEEAINAQAKKRLEELEAEIEKIREERRTQNEEWKKSQETLMQVNQAPQEKTFVEAQGKQRKGMTGFMKKKQGTKEMSKQVSG